MKRLRIYILIVLAVLIAFPVAAMASGAMENDIPVVVEPEPTSAPTPVPAPVVTPGAEEEPEPTDSPYDTTAVMRIDNVNVYGGMDRPYTSGYMPSASGGTAKVVLPLESDYPVTGNTVNVHFDLGTPGDSPFVFGNYDQTITKMVHETTTGSNEAFLVSVDLPLSAKRSMGSYPVIITTNGFLMDGTPFSQSFTIYVTINDGVDPDATPTPEPKEPTPTEKQPLPQPKIMLVNYEVTPSPIEAGDAFHLRASLTNTDESQSLNNVMITIAGETTDLLPTGAETGNFYFKKIGGGETVSVEMDMVASANIEPQPQKLAVKIEYEGAEASTTAFSAAESIVIPVLQPIRLEYDEPKIPESLNAGDTVSVSMNVMNLGLGTVHNVRMSLIAPGLEPDKTAFLGNIESGASKKGDLYVFVGTLDMGGVPDVSFEEEATGSTDETVISEDGAGGMGETIITEDGVGIVGEAIITQAGAGGETVELGDAALDEAAMLEDETAGMDGEMLEGEMDGMDETMPEDGMAGEEGKYGQTEGIVLLQYEDEFGTEYKDEFPFTSYINPPVIMAPVEEETGEAEQQALPQWWISIIIGGGVVVLILIIRGAVKSKEKRRREMEESGFNDEDV